MACETTIRASAYAGKTADVISTTPRSLITPYELDTSASHQAGAARYAYSETSGAGSPPRNAARPVSAIERETSVNSISSLKSVGVRRCHACHA